MTSALLLTILFDTGTSNKYTNDSLQKQTPPLSNFWKLYAYTTTALAETPEDLFELIMGVRQGGPESPPLYNLYMDYVMRVYMDLCEKSGAKFLQLKYRIRSTATKRKGRVKTTRGKHTVDWAGYADDLELFFTDTANLQKALDLLDKTFERFHLKINVSKTKTVIVNYKYMNNDRETYPKSICNLNRETVDNVEMSSTNL